jgi:hypothetical protein
MSIKRKEQRDLLEKKAKKGKSVEGAKTPGGQGGNKQSKPSNKKGKGGGAPGRNINPTAGLTAGQGMKFYPSLCHGAGLPETVYRTHNLANCNKKVVFSQALSAAVKPKPAPPSAGRGRGQLHRMEHNRIELTSCISKANTREQICRAFRAATTHEEVCQYRRVMDTTLKDTFFARHMPMYFDPHGNTELQSSLPMAYDETNSGFGQFIKLTFHNF